ncbi:MAG: 50S ribosomal protein L22 [Candidatus Magasanikbacteria bacterium RIFCSPHIGHO2_01_FULL_41_23]|uniref:Large ribosomal subunit protein uL22 n=1 Tax=Candidatus Magasanikbacteria bacterium RIFCSPLOWO2_01_FULL_40_15 TaxID=1798686 RepID=A0A1F6N239_9BACT|nr:MAG: 50S ribosomal protein L22 [Candidatus Magasanikbacteria bacterium RIFCSPHIGHO2_01_FULL_41_23]OGH66817.1 MAG: 50S ribosomal protein L22 [Candidatus Magasanikbacteria bacterium RIFCSPHIGHO2_02_FULL_41_35]OGH76663.1 MAG: 50S ribosomal protein L22 [Candidatus Magasanikbacteria bacterium RIFCSPHIGHO2_12_FULL_41_16]OGH77999.1 MAG: 50S ribosomal protein L22 [Candidatus Magasanikbacteria bacterium RIFCSPLOWO2_01_FULL_40_15]
METTATLKNLHLAPRKVRLVTDLIKGMSAIEAAQQLEFSRKHAARSILKLLRSAIANAEHNHKMAIQTLIIKNAVVDGGATLHRWMPRAMGRATPIRKRTSHITITLVGTESNLETVSVEPVVVSEVEPQTK